MISSLRPSKDNIEIHNRTIQGYEPLYLEAIKKKNKTYPKGWIKPLRQPVLKVAESNCVICLGEISNPLMGVVFSCCKYKVHILHLDKWLQLNSSCPACGKEPVQTYNLPIEY
ncbi:MAG: E3 ubiquitin protein ligase [Candidatus Heimdallarchaeota archaeon]|nr:E3 ubiquitin protein ligase [Candidatus Heimdallarchaeota archaeon]